MIGKFKNKYRIASTRLQTWDYGWNGAYFITICTQNRECFFGDIIDGKMQLSETGKIAHKFWIEIPNHFSFVKLGEFVVMPNHVHGIVIMDNNLETSNSENNGETPNLGVSAKNEKWKPGTLGVIINQYKRICTINARKINTEFGWQSRFYDVIIRNDRAFHAISNYIIQNPSKW
ncbi:MAG: transposase [Bacteroidota bacterium]